MIKLADILVRRNALLTLKGYETFKSLSDEEQE